MILFISLIFILIALALFFVLPPLLGRYKVSETLHNELNLAIYQQKLNELDEDPELSDEQKAVARKELEKSLLQDLDTDETATSTSNTGKNPLLATTIAVSIPLLALFMYSILGPVELPEILMGQADPAAQQAPAARQMPDINKMVATLEQKLKDKPDNAEGWHMLARSYLYLQRVDDAMDAFKKAMALDGKNPQLLADYAEALAIQNDGNMMGKPEQLVQQALAIQPMHPKSLWLAGAAKSQQGQYQAALDYWERLLALHEPGSEGAIELQKRIDMVKQTMKENGQTPVENKTTPVAKGKTAVTVEVSLDENLKTKAQPNETLFIFARAVDGPAMPLAVVRKQVKDLPLTVTLDDSMAMMPTLQMSNYDKIYISARISKSGSVRAASGDLEGRSGALNSGSKQTTSVTIATEVK